MYFKNFKWPHNSVKDGTNFEANQYFRMHLRRVFKILGLNIIDPDFKITPQFAILMFVAHSQVFSFCYMLFLDIPFGAKLEAFCVVSSVVQGIHKMYFVALYPKEAFIVFEIIRKLHLKFSDNREMAQVLKNLCVHSIIVTELLAVAFYGTLISYSLLPLFLWRNNGLVTTILPIQFPIIDWHTTFGYTINIIMHAYCLIAGLSGMLSADATFVYFVLHTIGFRKNFECHIDQLDKLLLEPGPQNKGKIKEQLNECIRVHQDYINYIEALDRIYTSVCMSQLVTSEMILSTALILTLWIQWIVGPFAAIIGLFQLLEYCILGTVVTIQNENISTCIYGFSWYLLPVQQQKLVLFMIDRAQQSPELNVGSFAKLNVATCMSFLKATYSFVMMMLEFIS